MLIAVVFVAESVPHFGLVLDLVKNFLFFFDMRSLFSPLLYFRLQKLLKLFFTVNFLKDRVLGWRFNDYVNDDDLTGLVQFVFSCRHQKGKWSH